MLALLTEEIKLSLLSKAFLWLSLSLTLSSSSQRTECTDFLSCYDFSEGYPPQLVPQLLPQLLLGSARPSMKVYWGIDGSRRDWYIFQFQVVVEFSYASTLIQGCEDFLTFFYLVADGFMGIFIDSRSFMLMVLIWVIVSRGTGFAYYYPCYQCFSDDQFLLLFEDFQSLFSGYGLSYGFLVSLIYLRSCFRLGCWGYYGFLSVYLLSDGLSYFCCYLGLGYYQLLRMESKSISSIETTCCVFNSFMGDSYMSIYSVNLITGLVSSIFSSGFFFCAYSNCFFFFSAYYNCFSLDSLSYFFSLYNCYFYLRIYSYLLANYYSRNLDAYCSFLWSYWIWLIALWSCNCLADSYFCRLSLSSSYCLFLFSSSYFIFMAFYFTALSKSYCSCFIRFYSSKTAFFKFPYFILAIRFYYLYWFTYAYFLSYFAFAFQYLRSSSSMAAKQIPFSLQNYWLLKCLMYFQ